MRVGIVHDYLTQRGGAERVVLEMLRAFPDAAIWTTLFEPRSTFPEFSDHDVRVSPLNKIAALRDDHRRALPVLPWAIRMHDIDDVDIVLASSSGWAHGVRSEAPKVVYCHNPARWLYQRADYLGEYSSRAARWGLRVSSPLLKRWDKAAAATAVRYLTNSSAVRDRIRAIYDIDAEILVPPPGLDLHGEQRPPPRCPAESSFALVVCRLLQYKNVDVVMEAMRELGTECVVVGDGPERVRLQAAAPTSVRFLTGVSDAELRWLYANCSFLVSASFEDLGLTPLEAAEFGKPSVVLGAGGFLDTVVDGTTGVYFGSPDPAAVAEACRAALATSWRPDVLTEHASMFGRERFASRLRDVLHEVVEGQNG